MRSTARRLIVSSPVAVLLAMAVLATLAATPADAQAWKGKGRLQGKIVDPDGKPYAGARITLRLVENPDVGPDPLTSDAKGRWSYLGLTGGLWTIRVETEEYLPSEGTFRVSEGGSPAPPLEIELQAPSPEQEQDAAMGAVERGNELFKAGRYAEARAAYEQALETIAALQKAIALAPDDLDTLRLLVSVLLAEGRNAEAEPYLARLPAEEKLDVASRLNLGIELYNDGDLDGALQHFDQAIADFPEEPEGYYYRGLCLLGKEQNDGAVTAFEKFLTIEPDSERATEARQFLDYLSGQ